MNKIFFPFLCDLANKIKFIYQEKSIFAVKVNNQFIEFMPPKHALNTDKSPPTKKFKRLCQSYTKAGTRCTRVPQEGFDENKCLRDSAYCKLHINSPIPKPEDKLCCLCRLKMADLKKACCSDCHKNKKWRTFYHEKTNVDDEPTEHVMEFLNTTSGEYTQITLRELGVILAKHMETSRYFGWSFKRFDISHKSAVMLLNKYEKLFGLPPVTNVEEYLKNKKSFKDIFDEFANRQQEQKEPPPPPPPKTDRKSSTSSSVRSTLLQTMAIDTKASYHAWILKNHPDKFSYITDPEERKKINDLFVQVKKEAEKVGIA